MKKLALIYVVTIVSLILFNLYVILMRAAHVQGIERIRITYRAFTFYSFQPFILPLVLLALIIGVSLIISKITKKKWSQRLFNPAEFIEEDEREHAITALACRNAYISMYISYPVIVVMLTFFPQLNEMVPHYPLIILLLLPLVQTTTLFVSISKRINR